MQTEWKYIEQIEGLQVWLGRTDNDRWLAARDQQPRFCVDGNTPEEAAAKAQRAIVFWRKVPKGGRRKR